MMIQSEAEGTLDLQAGGIATIDVQITFGLSLSMPAECLNVGPAGMGLTCAQFQETANRDPGDGPGNWVCSREDDGSCLCNSNQVLPRANHMGSWSVEGDILTLVGLDGGPMVDNGPNGPHSFCVDGDQLALREAGDEPAPVILLGRAE